MRENFMMTNCLMCKSPADVQIDTDDALFYLCTDPECNKRLPDYLKDHQWMIETGKTIMMTYENKKITFKIDGRTLPGMGKKLTEFIRKCKN